MTERPKNVFTTKLTFTDGGDNFTQSMVKEEYIYTGGPVEFEKTDVWAEVSVGAMYIMVELWDDGDWKSVNLIELPEEWPLTADFTAHCEYMDADMSVTLEVSVQGFYNCMDDYRKEKS